MSESADPDLPFRMEPNEILERWTRTARQADVNAVHRALFAVLDGSLFRTYRIVEDARIPNELYVIVKDDLVLKIQVNDINDVRSFDILAIGPRDSFATPHDGQHT